MLGVMTYLSNNMGVASRKNVEIIMDIGRLCRQFIVKDTFNSYIVYQSNIYLQLQDSTGK